MYRTIAVPLDTSSFAEQALRPARELAAAEEAALFLMSVSTLDHTADYLSQVIEKLAPTSDLTMLSGLDTDHSPADAIARLAAQPDVLVCMASHGRSWPARGLLGSVAADVLQQITAPVLLVGPRYRDGTTIVGGDLILPLDGSELAAQAIPPALSFAKTFDMRVWVVSVLGADTVGPTGSGDTLEAALVERAAQDLWHEHDRVEWEVLHGHPAVAIVDFAGRLPGALVAMTTHGRTGLRSLAGSVATRVVHTAPCPVLLSRPTE